MFGETVKEVRACAQAANRIMGARVRWSHYLHGIKGCRAEISERLKLSATLALLCFFFLVFQ
jgi:hypothetical protein